MVEPIAFVVGDEHVMVVGLVDEVVERGLGEVGDGTERLE